MVQSLSALNHPRAFPSLPAKSTSMLEIRLAKIGISDKCNFWDQHEEVLSRTQLFLPTKFKSLQKDLFTITRLKVAIYLARHFVHYFQFLIVRTKSDQLIFNWNKELIFYTKDPAESLYVFECVKGFWQFRVCVVLAGFSSLANHKGSADTVLWVKYMRPTYTLWTCTA